MKVKRLLLALIAFIGVLFALSNNGICSDFRETILLEYTYAKQASLITFSPDSEWVVALFVEGPNELKLVNVETGLEKMITYEDHLVKVYGGLLYEMFWDDNGNLFLYDRKSSDCYTLEISPPEAVLKIVKDFKSKGIDVWSMITTHSIAFSMPSPRDISKAGLRVAGKPLDKIITLYHENKKIASYKMRRELPFLRKMYPCLYFISASPDKKYIAYSIAWSPNDNFFSGSPRPYLYFFDVAKKKVYKIDENLSGHTLFMMDWLPDSRKFVYLRFVRKQNKYQLIQLKMSK